MQAAIRATSNLEVIEGGGRGSHRRRRRGGGHRHRRWPVHPCRRGGAHHGHVPARPDPSRRGEDPGGPPWRAAGQWPLRAPAGARTCGSAGSRPARRRASMARTIDWAGLEMQPGDDPPVPFSFLTERIETAQINCGVTTTTEATHAIIRANLARSPMYSGPDRAAWDRAIAPPSRTRWCGSPAGPGTRSSWSPRAWTTTPSIPTASPPRSRPTCRRPSCAPFRGWRRWPSGASAMPSSTTTSIRASLRPTLEVKRLPRPVPRRPDQRHHRATRRPARRVSPPASTPR